MSMKSLTQFQFESTEVRTVVIEDEPWFVAVDICRVLGLKNVTQATSRLFDDETQVIDLSALYFNKGVGNNDLRIVSEFGLYALVLGSRKPEARKFQRWITKEVLPAIRKTGCYFVEFQRCCPTS